jgi:MFS family permease
MRQDELANTWKCTAGEGLFGVGMGLVSAMTVLPLLLKQLGAGEVLLGLAFGITTAGWGLLQPVGMLVFGRRRRTKRFLVPWSFASAVPTYLAMGLVVYFLGPARPALCSLIIVACFTVRILGAGLATPLWYDWHAVLFSREIRGRAIGMMAGASALGATLAAAIAGVVRLKWGFPANYSALFLMGIFFFGIALSCFLWVREPRELDRPSPYLKAADLFRRFGHSLGETNFRNYLVGRVLLTLGGGAVGFYAVHFKSPQGGGLEESTVILLGTLLTLPQAASSYILGRLGDRAGHKLGVIVGALAQAASLLAAFYGAGAWACALSFSLLGVAWASNWVSHANMLFETCPHDSRVAHITVSNMVLSPFLILVPLATGWLMALASVGVRNGIGLTLIPAALGVAWMVFVVKEPRDMDIPARNGNQAGVPARRSGLSTVAPDASRRAS